MGLLNMLHVRALLTRPTGVRSETIFAPAVALRIALAMALVVLVGVARATPPLLGLRADIAWLAALVFSGAFPLSTWRPSALAAGCCALCGVIVEAVSPSATGLVMIVIAIVQAGRLAPPLGPALAVAAVLAYEAADVARARVFDPGTLLSSASGLAFAYLAVSSYRRLREEKRTTERLLDEVRAGRDAQIHAAALDERARIAREIHDILAHTLSALAVQLEGTRLLVEQRPGDPAAVAALERASGLARDGLEETKRAVGALRGDTLPGPEELPQLAAAFERDTAVPCRFTRTGEPVAMPPEARLALYRTAQEALTNVRKHAVATWIEISLRYGEDSADLTIEDEGTPRQTALPGGGNGLNGMRERAALAHGHLEAGPTSKGFRVHLWLPA